MNATKSHATIVFVETKVSEMYVIIACHKFWNKYFGNESVVPN